MQIFKKCKKCGELLTINSECKVVVCNHCDSEFETSHLLDYLDELFLKNMSSDEIDNSLKYNSHILEGNENISKGLYQKAVECFKQAIEINETRYEAYYGIARAKTQDFTVVPDTTDYLEYAKLALEFADDDIDQKINANLAKLGISKK